MEEFAQEPEQYELRVRRITMKFVDSSRNAWTLREQLYL